MATFSILHVMTILTPTFFVLALGYAAGRYHLFDGEKSKGVTELVLDFALPAALFIGVVTFPHQELLQATPLFQAFFLVFLPTYILVFFVTRCIFHQTIGASSIAALLVTFPSTSFFGASVVGGLFGTSSGISISISVIIAVGIFVPLSIVLLETSTRTHIGDRGKQQDSRDYSRNSTYLKRSELALVIGRSVVKALKQPIVWAPLSALLISLLGVRVPEVAISSLNLIGSATSGVGIFVAGLALAVHRIKLNRIVIFNVLLKSLVQPTLMIGIISMLGVKGIFANEAVILCVLPSAVLPVLLAIRYRMYESEASST
ncbi:MAG: AEC family transporter, partial [Nitrososphaeraceae archaeon]